MNVYESEKLRKVTGPAIRPGGFELTSKGVSLCRIPRGAAVLDVGCGSGAAVEHLRIEHGLKAAGLDLSGQLLAEGRKRNRSLPLIRADASRIPVRSEFPAAVFCECVLSLTADPGGVLKEFFRVVKPGGALVLTDIYLRTPESHGEFDPMTINCCLKGAVSKDRILKMVSDAGFSILAWEDHTNLLKTLAAQMVFEYGSMRRFWSSFCTSAESDRIVAGIDRLRPGYYFLAAKKESNNG